MTSTLLFIIIALQILSISIFFLKKTPSIDLLKKDILILEKNIDIMRSQIQLMLAKSNLDAVRIAELEKICFNKIKTIKSDNNFN
jgi:hypothetical protein